MLVICVFSFAGCSSAKPLSSINTSFSSIYYAIDCSQSGFEDMTQQEQAVLKNKVQSLATTYANEVKLRYISVLNSMVLSNKITSSESVLYQNHLTPYIGWNETTFVIEFRFYTTLASRIFITSCEYSGAVNEEQAFATITTEKFSNIFSKTKNNIISSTLENYFDKGIVQALSSLGQDSANKFEGARYYYFFITQNSRLHCKGADEKLSTSAGQIFCYYALEGNEELSFEFYVVQANQFAYYMIALAITFVFIAIYLVVIYFKRPKDDNNQQKIEANEIEIKIEE